MTPAELIEKALRTHMRVCVGVPMSGAEAEDAARIALDALEGVIKALRRHRDTAEAGIAHLEERVVRLQRRAGNAEERLALARDAILRDGYFRPDEVGPDVAPRIIERLSALSSERDEWRERAYAAEAKTIVVRMMARQWAVVDQMTGDAASPDDAVLAGVGRELLAALDDTKPEDEP